MARKTIYKKRPRTRWSVNIQPIQIEEPVGTSQNVFAYQTLCANPSKTNNHPIEQLFTVKNIEFSFRVVFDALSNAKYDGIRDLTAYVMYVPAGGVLDNDLPISHPEWVMAYKFLGTPLVTMNENAPLKIRSRLARKLHSGDYIMFLLKGTNSGGTTFTLQINGLVKYYTKSN